MQGIPSLSRQVPRPEFRRSARVQVNLPFNYRMVVSDVVVPEERMGMILDIGYHGMRAEIALAPARFSEIVLDVDLPLVGQRITQLSGKVVNVVEREYAIRIGVEFIGMTAEQRAAFQLFVQLLIQGAETD